MILLRKNFPKTLVIGESVWEIKFARVIPGEKPDTLGLCDPSTSTIWIRTGQTPKERFKCLCHELAHSLCHEYKIGENHETIYKIEEPLYRLFVDNGLVL
jgi:hypothetical protein